MGFDRSKDRDYAGQTLDMAVTQFEEIPRLLSGAPAQAHEIYKAAHSGFSTANTTINSAEYEVDRWLGDSTVYPNGRYEKANAAYEKASAVVEHELSRIKAAATMMGSLLESEALPKFVGDAAEQAFVREEIRDIVSRSSNPTATLSKLTQDARYMALVASPFGRSLLLERGTNDRQVANAHELVRAAATQWVAMNGTDAQRQAVGRLVVGEKMQGAYAAAWSAFQMKIEAMGAKVGAVGRGITMREARERQIEGQRQHAR